MAMDIPSGITGAAPATSPAATRRHAIFATVIGSGLEWFDFSGYAFFAAIILAFFLKTVRSK